MEGSPKFAESQTIRTELREVRRDIGLIGINVDHPIRSVRWESAWTPIAQPCWTSAATRRPRSTTHHVR